MKAGPDNYKTAIRKQKEIAAFMEKVQNKCRVLVFVDTHANSGTGSLQITAAKPPKCVSIDVVSGPAANRFIHCLTTRHVPSS